MGVTYKVLAQSCPTDTNLTTAYTVPSGTSTVVSSIVVANLSAVNKQYRIAVRPAGAAIESKHYNAYDATVAANDSVSIVIGMTLAATDVISVRSSAANDLAFSIYGSEITP